MDIKKCNICNCVSFAFNGLKKSNLNLEKISEESKVAIRKIAKYYSINENEAILLILAIEAHYSSDNEFNIIGFKEIREKNGCAVMKVIPFKNQILSLIERHFFFRNRNGFDITKDAFARIQGLFVSNSPGEGRTFSNARLARNLFENAVMNQAQRLSGIDNPSDFDLTVIVREDLSA